MTILVPLSATPSRRHVVPCFRCRLSFDFLSSALCNCIVHERTFVCPHCGGCACTASADARNEFWSMAPPALWERRQREKSVGASGPQTLEASSLPRPFALIIDDDPLVLRVAEHALRAIGFTTMTNSNPQEAYSIARSMLPDLVLTDALMPRLDGRDLCLQLKRDPLTSGIKVIVMSALYRGMAYRNEAFKKFHVDEYLEKPIIPGVLRQAVDQLMPELARAHPHSNDVRKAS